MNLSWGGRESESQNESSCFQLDRNTEFLPGKKYLPTELAVGLGLESALDPARILRPESAGSNGTVVPPFSHSRNLA